MSKVAVTISIDDLRAAVSGEVYSQGEGLINPDHDGLDEEAVTLLVDSIVTAVKVAGRLSEDKPVTNQRSFTPYPKSKTQGGHFRGG
jgi:hypothetical protein